METEELEALFHKYGDDEFLKFDRVTEKRSRRKDLHAFLLLAELFPNSDRDMVAGATYDEIGLEPDMDELAKVVTEAQVIELIRCGVRCDEGGLCMFV